MRYAFDATDRLRKVFRADGSQVEYLYDPFGRRIEKTVSGVTSMH